jgi:hypothetical protein
MTHLNLQQGGIQGCCNDLVVRVQAVCGPCMYFQL